MGKNRKRRHQPSDPAEIARKARMIRMNPHMWGENREALALPQYADVQTTEATRERTARIYRWDCFELLCKRGALSHNADEALARLAGVRRFETVLAVRMRLEGTQGTGTGGGQPIPVSDASLEAAQCIEGIEQRMKPFLFGLLHKLVSPAVQRGQTLGNWRKVVEDHAGEFRHVEQGKLVATCAADLLDAWQSWDNRLKRAA